MAGRRVLEAGGEASVWLSRPTTVGQRRQLETKMAEAAAEAYRAVLLDAQAALDEDPTARRRIAARLERELARIADRDHFPPSERDRARRAVARLAASIEVEACNGQPPSTAMWTAPLAPG